MIEFKNIEFLQTSQTVSVRKNRVIKNVAFIIQVIGGELITVELNPPRNLKITNKATRTRKGQKGRADE